MTRYFRLSLLCLAVALAGPAVKAGTYQTIVVHVDARERARVDGAAVPLKDLTAAVASRVDGQGRVVVKVFIRIGTSKAVARKIIAQCRAAGAKTVSVAYKA